MNASARKIWWGGVTLVAWAVMTPLAAAELSDGRFPPLHAVSAIDSQLRSEAAWAAAVADLQSSAAALRQLGTAPSTDVSTAAFEAATRAELNPNLVTAVTPAEQAASAAFVKALKSRASAPPRPK